MRNFYLLLTALTFTAGIISAALGLSVFSPVLIAILFVPLILFRKNNTAFLILLFLMIFLLGGFRCKQPDMPLGHAILRGRVASDPEKTPAGRKVKFLLDTGSMGPVLVNAYDPKVFEYKYGDLIRLEGIAGKKGARNTLNVKRDYFSEKTGEDRRMFTRIVRVIYSIRQKLETHIDNYLNPPYGSVLKAILLGKRGAISRKLTDLFAKTGTLHILAISGLHVGIIYLALRVVLKILKIGRGASTALSVLFLICFAIMTGARPSILRAVTMFSILSVSELMKRKMDIFNLIGLSCLIMLIVNPDQVFNLGFILSYAALLSIVGITPIFYGRFSLKKPLLKPVLISLSIFIGLSPLIAYYFGLITPIVVVANLIALPLLVLIMGSGLLFITVGLLSKAMALVLSQSVWFFIVILINSVKFLKKLPFAYFEVPRPHLWVVIGYYIILVSVISIIPKRNQLFHS